MDKIIDIFGKTKNRKTFLFKTLKLSVRSVHVPIILLNCVKNGSIALFVS